MTQRAFSKLAFLIVMALNCLWVHREYNPEFLGMISGSFLKRQFNFLYIQMSEQ